MTSSDLQEQLNSKAIRLLEEDADKIQKLIQVQMENLATRYCPLYEEVLDTQVFGFSKEVDFAVRAGLLPVGTGKQLVNNLERNLAVLYEALNKKGNQE
ncbi:YlaN family protein [Paenibacillus sp. Marseille-Q4541]|uniref:YlaN family protein n=1 Tax=Paenibacillus sp. Marseille-Q4541 TaxID=2831522 RepID=UPI001BAD85A6|nr:YlaN family protein [Paenibacillus sp. Marseille-Q4541]